MTITDENLQQLAQSLGEELLQRQLKVCCAESCTGGWVAQIITSIAGSSGWFDRGFVTYTDQAKQEMLGVPTHTLASFGAVSQQTVIAMAEGALQYSTADLSVAITGIAGPDGGRPDKPVGTVWLGWASRDGKTRSERQQFEGDREQVRRQAVSRALSGLLEMLASPQ